MAENDEGNVNVLISDDELVSDGDAKLVLVTAAVAQAGERVFCFTAIDGGGFTGILVTPEAWERMKTKVDAYVATLPPKGH